MPTLRGECLSVVRPIRPSGRATLHCIIWMSARADPPEGPGFGRGGPGQEHQTKLANLDLVAVDQHRGVDRFMMTYVLLRLSRSTSRNCPFSSRNSTWRRLTVASSRKMSLSECRPADVTG